MPVTKKVTDELEHLSKLTKVFVKAVSGSLSRITHIPADERGLLRSSRLKQALDTFEAGQEMIEEVRKNPTGRSDGG